MTGLIPEQLESFDRDGYLIIENVLDQATLNALREEYAQRLDAIALRLYDEGKLPSTIYSGRVTPTCRFALEEAADSTTSGWGKHG